MVLASFGHFSEMHLACFGNMFGMVFKRFWGDVDDVWGHVGVLLWHLDFTML